MGLLDQVLGGLAAKEGQHAALYEEVGKVVSQSGGIGGLYRQFQQKGLGGMIAGWVSTGPNPPISAEQVIQVLGRDRVVAIASKAGLSEEQVTAGISKILPIVIDRLTPNGTVPDHATGELEGKLGALKSSLLGPGAAQPEPGPKSG